MFYQFYSYEFLIKATAETYYRTAEEQQKKKKKR